MAAPRPNIIVIMADDLGFSDLGCYGGEIQTPNLDALAAEGMRFTRAYNNAVCVPTRASLLTGLYPGEAADSRGRLRPTGTATTAEVLSAAGYRTLMVGKWHNGSDPECLPVARGFDRHWGLVSGGCNYFNPGLPRPGEPAPMHKTEGDLRPWADDANVIRPFTPEDPDFYITDAFTDRAVDWLRQYGAEERPFYLYAAYTAPHFPLQARPEDIDRYRGTYLAGWDELRGHRFERMAAVGVIDPSWQLSPRDPRAPAWQDVREREEWDQRMAVHAAMVDRLDQGVGRILAAVRALGKDRDTMVVFLSDNGACAEPWHLTPEVEAGPVDSYRTMDPPWANLSNTPFRLFKVFDHEGGIATPFIVRWPAQIVAGEFCHEMVHVMDFMPTCIDLAGGRYPEQRGGVAVPPHHGRSFAPALTHGPSTDLGEREPMFWEYGSSRAVRDGRWKLVTEGPPRTQHGVQVWSNQGWELYDLGEDRSELRNLAAVEPARTRDMAALWQRWWDGLPDTPGR
jgi:arylsulfatase A-like enzyme